jgi:hypothetical protein
MHRHHPCLASFEAIACHYLDEYAPEADRQKRWFACPSLTLTQVIERACASRLENGRLHSDQQRPFGVWPKAPADAARRLKSLTNELAGAPDFDALHETIRSALWRVKGIGELTVYDIANRIGASLGLEPTQIYLHSGSRKGARTLRLPPNRPSLPMSVLPEGLRQLTAAQAEDVLCIYHADFARITGGNGRPG